MPPFKSAARIYPPIPAINRPLTLEVERKFALTPASLSLLRTNTGAPAFDPFTPLPTTSITDTYLDQNGLLFSRGIYIRSRNGALEAKIRQSGDYTTSSFLETQDPSRIGTLIREAFAQRGHGVVGPEDLVPVASFVTHREEWDVNGGFRVVIDSMNFGHVVGEVEVVMGQDGDGRGGGGEQSERFLQESEEAVLRLEKFMEEYEWAFPKGSVKGKLTAFFEWEKKNGRYWG